MNLPSPVNANLAAAAVADFFTLENWRDASRENEWVFSMINRLVVIVSMRSVTVEGRAEWFTVRLSCDYYPTHPPDAIFVNPETLTYEYGKDNSFVANLAAPYCRTHLNFDYKPPYKYGPQLVCSSMTLGYYFSKHTPTEDQVWRPGYHTIGSTVFAIHKALQSQHYKGRHV